MENFTIKTEIETFNDEDKFNMMCLKLKKNDWTIKSERHLGIKGFNYTCKAVLIKEIKLS